MKHYRMVQTCKSGVFFRGGLDPVVSMVSMLEVNTGGVHMTMMK